MLENKRPRTFDEKFTSRFLVRLSLAILGSLAMFFIWSVAVEPGLLFVRSYTLEIPNWPIELNGTKVAVITDLHVGAPHIDLNKVHRIVDLTNASNPDLILLLGDFVSAHSERCSVPPAKFVPELADLKAKAGVFAVLGNHDWWYNGKDVQAELTNAHIKVLENSTAQVMINLKVLWLVGLADLWTRKPELKKPFLTVPKDSPILLLTHSPDVFPQVPERVSLVLAGHTHGGQVAIPFIGPLIVPSRYGAQYARGIIIDGMKQMFVSSGIGTSILPVRFLVPPEISMLTLNTRTAIEMDKQTKQPGTEYRK